MRFRPNLPAIGEKHRLSGIVPLWWAKIRRRTRVKEEIEHDSEQHAVHGQLKQGVKDTHDEVESHPNSTKPACPIEAAKHEHPAKDREQSARRDNTNVNEFLRFQFGDLLGRAGTNQRQQASNQ